MNWRLMHILSAWWILVSLRAIAPQTSHQRSCLCYKWHSYFLWPSQSLILWKIGGIFLFSSVFVNIKWKLSLDAFEWCCNIDHYLNDCLCHSIPLTWGIGRMPVVTLDEELVSCPYIRMPYDFCTSQLFFMILIDKVLNKEWSLFPSVMSMSALSKLWWPY